MARTFTNKEVMASAINELRGRTMNEIVATAKMRKNVMN